MWVLPEPELGDSGGVHPSSAARQEFGWEGADGGGVPLMRERAKQETILAQIGGLLRLPSGYQYIPG